LAFGILFSNRRIEEKEMARRGAELTEKYFFCGCPLVFCSVTGGFMKKKWHAVGQS
jgi:hypothetical protein